MSIRKLKRFVKDALPYAAMAAPFIPGLGIGSLGTKIMGSKLASTFGAKGLMSSPFWSSIVGGAVKDAVFKGIVSKALNKRNPQLIAKDAFLRGIFLNAYKTGFDPTMMMGGDETLEIPGVPARVSDRVSIKDYENLITPADKVSGVTPKYTEYGQSMMDKWYGPGRGGPNIAPSPYDVTTGYEMDDKYTWDRVTPEWTVPEINKDLIVPPPYSPFTDVETTYETFPDKMEGAIPPLPGGTAENPLAGLGYMTKEKTTPSLLDTLTGKAKGAKDLGIEKGTDEYDEYFGLGKTTADPLWLAGTAYDLYRDPLTEGDVEEDDEEKYRKFMARMAITPGGSLEGFLGNRGGIASLANGGQPVTLPLTTLDYTDPDWYKGTDDDIIPAPVLPGDIDFADEFEGYLDLVSGDPATDYTDMWREYNRQAIQAGLPTITFEEFMELRGDSDQAAADPQTLGRFPVIGGEMAAQGGRMGYYGGGELNAIPGGMVNGPGTEVSDSIPAQLSNNEFVFTADSVRAAGGGDIDLGAQKMYGIMNALDPDSAKLGEPPVYS